MRAARRRAFDEQLWRGKCLGNRRDPRVVRRTSKRIQSVDVLALDLEGLATGANDGDKAFSRADSVKTSSSRPTIPIMRPCKLACGKLNPAASSP